mmetsp:Transcript_26070/g.54396  ORF Transcript_26070/g.54396 Transcript_26070/m.54396 type:complete len:84 (-) Transcript_26070:877-1128(-)
MVWHTSARPHQVFQKIKERGNNKFKRAAHKIKEVSNSLKDRLYKSKASLIGPKKDKPTQRDPKDTRLQAMKKTTYTLLTERPF